MFDYVLKSGIGVLSGIGIALEAQRGSPSNQPASKAPPIGPQ
jgi:hypothetical protein